MTGYYSLGLTGYIVTIKDQDHVTWQFVGTIDEQPVHKAKIYFTLNDRAYFRANNRRIHLDQCLREDL